MNNCKTEARGAFKQALNDYKISTGRVYPGLTTAGQKYAR